MESIESVLHLVSIKQFKPAKALCKKASRGWNTALGLFIDAEQMYQLMSFLEHRKGLASKFKSLYIAAANALHRLKLVETSPDLLVLWSGLEEVLSMRLWFSRMLLMLQRQRTVLNSKKLLDDVEKFSIDLDLSLKSPLLDCFSVLLRQETELWKRMLMLEGFLDKLDWKRSVIEIVILKQLMQKFILPSLEWVRHIWENLQKRALFLFGRELDDASGKETIDKAMERLGFDGCVFVGHNVEHDGLAAFPGVLLCGTEWVWETERPGIVSLILSEQSYLKTYGKPLYFDESTGRGKTFCVAQVSQELWIVLLYQTQKSRRLCREGLDWLEHLADSSRFQV